MSTRSIIDDMAAKTTNIDFELIDIETLRHQISNSIIAHLKMFVPSQILY